MRSGVPIQVSSPTDAAPPIVVEHLLGRALLRCTDSPVRRRQARFPLHRRRTDFSEPCLGRQPTTQAERLAVRLHEDEGLLHVLAEPEILGQGPQAAAEGGPGWPSAASEAPDQHQPASEADHEERHAEGPEDADEGEDVSGTNGWTHMPGPGGHGHDDLPRADRGISRMPVRSGKHCQRGLD